MKKKTIISLITVALLGSAIVIYTRKTHAINGSGTDEHGYSVACLQQGKPGGVLIRKRIGYHLALSDRASNRCFYKFNNAFVGKRNAKDEPIDFNEYDVITVSYRSPIYKELKNNPGYLWKAINFPFVSFTRADGPYAHLFTPTPGGTRHILLAPSGPLVNNWNEVCTALGGDTKACYP